jgi:hypothetical protein
MEVSIFSVSGGKATSGLGCSLFPPDNGGVPEPVATDGINGGVFNPLIDEVVGWP